MPFPLRLFLVPGDFSETVAPSYLGLAPGFVGLYQLNFQIPYDIPVSGAINILEVGSLYAQLPLAVPAN